MERTLIFRNITRISKYATSKSTMRHRQQIFNIVKQQRPLLRILPLRTPGLMPCLHHHFISGIN